MKMNVLAAQRRPTVAQATEQEDPPTQPGPVAVMARHLVNAKLAERRPAP